MGLWAEIVELIAFRRALRRGRDLVWPPRCLHCSRYEEGAKWFCRSCREGFALRGKRAKRIGVYDVVASLYDHEGAPLTLRRRMQRVDSGGQARLIASLMVMKLKKLDWPIPGRVVAATKSDRMVAQAFSKMVKSEERSSILVIALDQSTLIERGFELIKDRPKSLMALSFLGSVSSYESAFGASRLSRSDS